MSALGGGRIGLFGGTFNPVHLAHLRAAEEIRMRCQLDGIRIVLAASPPHKESSQLAPAADRLRMIELAIQDTEGLRASTIEIERGGTSYSIDTIRQVLAEPASPSALTLILGLDAFRDLDTWKEHTEVFAHCDVAVLSRPGYRDMLTLDDLPVATRGHFCYDPLRDCFRHDSGHTVALHRITSLNISATEIRRQVKEGRSIRYLVPAPVARYIYDRQLYVSRPRRVSAR
jgi:nicotinate-nucleotide adenylyltransferase